MALSLSLATSDQKLIDAGGEIQLTLAGQWEVSGPGLANMRLVSRGQTTRLAVRPASYLPIVIDLKPAPGASPFVRVFRMLRLLD